MIATAYANEMFLQLLASRQLPMLLLLKGQIIRGSQIIAPYWIHLAMWLMKIHG